MSKKNQSIKATRLQGDAWTWATQDNKFHYLELVDLTAMADELANEYQKAILEHMDFIFDINETHSADEGVLDFVTPVMIKVLESGALPVNHSESNNVDMREGFDAFITSDFTIRQIGGSRGRSLLDPLTNNDFIGRFAFKFGVNFPKNLDLIAEKSKGVTYAVGLVLQNMQLSPSAHHVFAKWQRNIRYRLVSRQL